MQSPHAAASSPVKRLRVSAAALTLGVLASMGFAASSLAAPLYGPYNIRVVHTKKCMDVSGGPGATGDGVGVLQWPCGGPAATNQQWYFEDTGDGLTYFVRARHSNKCLEVRGGTGATGNGAPLQQWGCRGYAQSNQRWYLTRSPIGGETFNLRAAHSNSCAEVFGASTDDGAPLRQWQCLGASQTNQWWYLTTP
jgi:hypothetical protein